MAITQAMCTSFKKECLLGVHRFGTNSADTFKLALYTSSASLGASTTAFTTSNQVSASGSYSSGGGKSKKTTKRRKVMKRRKTIKRREFKPRR